MTVAAGLSIVLHPEPTAPALARRFLREALGGRVDEHVHDTAVLLVSELVTNAVLHGHGVLSVEVVATATAVRVTVVDEHRRSPLLLPSDLDSLHGRGMLIVAALASAWGVDPRPPGKAVWFELGA